MYCLMQCFYKPRIWMYRRHCFHQFLLSNRGLHEVRHLLLDQSNRRCLFVPCPQVPAGLGDLLHLSLQWDHVRQEGHLFQVGLRVLVDLQAPEFLLRLLLFHLSLQQDHLCHHVQQVPVVHVARPFQEVQEVQLHIVESIIVMIA